MILYPAIELSGGRCVSLRRGRVDAPQVWHRDPLEVACGYAAVGAEWLHLTDFDAMAGDLRNADVIDRILRTAGLNVQIGGGVRSFDRIAHWIDRGAARVVLGTVAVQAPDLVRRAAKYHPDQIVVAVDVRGGRVLTEGWTAQSAFAPETLLAQFRDDPLAAVLITDVDADTGEAERSLGLIGGLARQTRHPVIASGLVRTAEDLSRLVHAGGVAGAVIGRALFDRTLELATALELAAPPGTPRATFL
ncbi:1-(5-phosphoribosyl)-5-[(5-phosphoribosylamino)methylideneamino] imidazole-4-carboxamide isomerase [Rhodobacteraceae bacterium CCMM004]|nr:1-(5-phosphoribosyl)-5-[(5-phosphoribosylamino)methylideneamino] imidazole-4-carboxamide isomerase [Rhodobacteraceae bacterium CCMM004]